MNRSSLWPYLLQGLLALALPIFLIGVNMRLTTSHWFVQREYRKVDFPSDPYGLSTAERIRLAEACVDYLATDADISLLENLRLTSGAQAFNARELRHMVDVQAVYGKLLKSCVAAALALAGGILALLAGGPARRRVLTAFVGGCLLTLGLLTAIGAIMILNWGGFFTTFHRIFFEADTWRFQYSDSLIRLFPMRFWRDVAVTIVGLLLAEIAVIGGTGWVWLKRQRSLNHQAAI